MKKTLFLIFSIIISYSLIIFLASAQETTEISDNQQIEEIIQAQEISVADLGIESPGMLPSSPFYFLKEWRRTIRKIFTFNPIKKAELELKEANERAAEIKKLEEISPSNIKAIDKAAENYQRNVERLKNRLEALKETSQNPNIDNLLNKLVDRSLQHQELFDNLKAKFQERTELIERLRASQEKIAEIVAEIPERFEDINTFRQRLENAVQNRIEDRTEGSRRILYGLRMIEITDRVREKLTEQQQTKIQEIQDKLIEKFESQIEKLTDVEKAKNLIPEVLKQLPGDQLKRIRILEGLKENLTNPEIQRQIEEAAEEILQVKVENQEITREEVGRIINRIEIFIGKVEALLNQELADESDIIRQSVKELIETAKNHLQRAKQAFNEDKIGEAFGQITAAEAAARNVLRQINQIEVGCPLIAPACPEGQTAVRSGERDEKGCPILKCAPLKVPIEVPPPTSPVPTSSKTFCIQVITPAKNPQTGECREFSTPCDVPAGWQKVESCPNEF